jgi:hypothetical protein
MGQGFGMVPGDPLAHALEVDVLDRARAAAGRQEGLLKVVDLLEADATFGLGLRFVRILFWRGVGVSDVDEGFDQIFIGFVHQYNNYYVFYKICMVASYSRIIQNHYRGGSR